MVIHVEPSRLHRDGDRPAAITGVGVAGPPSGYRTSDILLGTPTCSARTRHGLWALYQNGTDVVVVHPGGAMLGPPTHVAGELDRLFDTRDTRPDEFDRAAAGAILAFLTGPDTQDEGVPTVRTWSSPAKGYWLSGPTNQPGTGQDGQGQPSSWPGAPARPPAPQVLPGVLPARHTRPDPGQPAPRAA